MTPRLYIPADVWGPGPLRDFANRVEGQAGWRVGKRPCSHDVMVDLPKELAAQRLALA